MSPRTVKVAVCDDSLAFSAALREYLERDPGIKVVATFPDAEKLLAALNGLPADLITMDLELPGMDGVEATRRILAARPIPVVVLSSHIGPGSGRAAAALGAGALDAIPKSRVRLQEGDDVWARALRSRLRRLASVRLERPARAPSRPPPRPVRSMLPRRARVVGIGASTGGPPALARVLGALPAAYPLPVLVVQHIAPGFIEGMAAWLEARTSLPVRLAAHGQPAGPGIWFAPDDRHLTLNREMRFALSARNGTQHRPSVDVLFSSLALAAGQDAVAVVLSGMGRDGAEGVQAIRAAGGFVLAQDQQTSAVFGMPRGAADAGADLVLAVDEIGPALRLLRLPAPEK